MVSTVTRRTFVHGSLAGSATMALASTGATTATRTDALVVGAGMAGLAAADSLRRNGVNVIVLEGRHRIGGRVWTSSTKLDVPIDLGASFIHHAEESPLTPFCERHNIKTRLVPLDQIAMFFAHRKALPKPQVDDAVGIFVAVTAGLQVVAALRQQASLPDIPLSRALEIVFANLNLTGKQKALFDIAQAWFIRTATGASPEFISLYNTLAHLSPGEQDRAFPGGYVQVADVLARGIDIRLRHVVQEIDYRNAKVKVTTNRGVFRADHVVVTLPIGVLQSGSVKFLPDLPQRKRDAIRRARLGVVNKLFLQFPKQFWESDPSLFLRTPGPDGRWPAFINFQKVTDAPILMCFNSGIFALATEALPLPNLVRDAMAALRTMFRTVPSPVKAARSQWASDPFSRGSYPFSPIGSRSNDPDLIAEPVNGRLFFAGDGTRNGDAEVRGAFRSGRRAAKEIGAIG